MQETSKGEGGQMKRISLLLSVLFIIGCGPWQEPEPVKANSGDKYVTHSSEYLNNLLDRAEKKGMQVACRPLNGMILEPCMTQIVESFVGFIDENKCRGESLR